MINSKPNYRIGNYSASSESREIISKLSLRKKMSQLEDRTFCSCHDQDEAGREYTCCPEGCGCLCDSEDIHDRELEKDLCSNGKEHQFGFSDSRIYVNGHEISITHCKICHIQYPSDAEISLLEDKYEKSPPGFLAQSHEEINESEGLCTCDTIPRKDNNYSNV